VAKYDDRIEALGVVDEATSALGLARASAAEERVRGILLEQQRVLYRLMAEIAMPPETVGKLAVAVVGEADVEQLEAIAEDLKREVEIGNRFIIPGESVSGAALDLARAVVRRAERQLVRMLHAGTVTNAEMIRYLNRLSDTLFILARFVERGQSCEAT
jgi:cob(I)alamin adenosyltransferase